jgi:hypothetical protein
MWPQLRAGINDAGASAEADDFDQLNTDLERDRSDAHVDGP